MFVATKICEEVSAGWGLILSVPKTKLLVAVVELSPVDLAPLQLNGDAVEVIREFKYLGSLVEASGRMTGEIDQHIVQASKAFGSLRSAVFLAHDLSLEMKRLVYCFVVLGVLYGAETWAPTQVLVRKLEWFHRRCVRCIMGVGKTVQWAQHITTTQLAECFGMNESSNHLLGQSRLRWLGHLAQMSDRLTPKCLLFGWFSQKRPTHGVKLCWRDKVRQDLKSFGIPETSWYVQAQERSVWRGLCHEGSLQLLVASILNQEFLYLRVYCLPPSVL